MKDIRTPATYFENRYSRENSLKKLKGKLDELLTALYALKERGEGTPATKKIIEDEIDKAELNLYKKLSKENASKVVEALVHGTPEDAEEAMWEALDYKAFCRVEPYLIVSGKQIEEDVFRN